MRFNQEEFVGVIRGRGARPGSVFLPLTASPWRLGHGCRFSGPNSSTQKITSGSPSSGITSPSAIACRCSIRAFFTAYSGLVDVFQVFFGGRRRRSATGSVCGTSGHSERLAGQPLAWCGRGTTIAA